MQCSHAECKSGVARLSTPRESGEKLIAPLPAFRLFLSECKQISPVMHIFHFGRGRVANPRLAAAMPHHTDNTAEDRRRGAVRRALLFFFFPPQIRGGSWPRPRPSHTFRRVAAALV